MGKPGPGHAGSSAFEYIERRSNTRGSETSQYPEEKKAIAIPSVVASEAGIAQTDLLAGRGCGTSMWYCQRIAERHGKAGHRG